MKKNLFLGLIVIAVLTLALSGCFLMPKASLKEGYYLVTSYNDWSENPTILGKYQFSNDELTIDTSAHATFLYYVIKVDASGKLTRYGSKDGAKVFAYGNENSQFYIHPSMMKENEIVGIGDNTKNNKDFYFHGSLNSWQATKMQRISGGATLTYTATEVPMGKVEFKITVATATWIDPQTFNGSWNAPGGENIKMNVLEDAATVTIIFNPETDYATLTYIKSSVPLTPEYYVVGSFNGWNSNAGVKLNGPDENGEYTTTMSTSSKFATGTSGLVEYKVIKKYKTNVDWYGLGNHFFSATTTSVNFYCKVDSNGDVTYGTDMAAMDGLPLAVAGDFNGWADTLMKIEGTTYEATIAGNFKAGNYNLKIKKPGTWDSYKYPDNNLSVELSDSASEIQITFDPKTWNISLTKVK